ncbi:Squamosa promoter-binding-like protein 12 [Apostasia shenzhenica]|uniref:Squamosa promoter-binding-like protein 12 n=1 Tax=Apostasia shenzhenica TaxID=1088818 RepID=A0A2I0A7N8_9ASPA|nr:Squamosa promoter-binding-like protein 12 [Apostasia shenzhenica]
MEWDLNDWNWDGDQFTARQTNASTSDVSSSRGACQVEGCGADLSTSKDYHRRHKVCEIHAKSTSALVNNVFQRFCQQCSRFHLLQEFDEGKRSCRRRLAGHNRRRRKTHPEAIANGTSTIDEQASSYLLISLIRILSNLQCKISFNLKDQDLLSNVIRSLDGLAGSVDTRNLSEPLQNRIGSREFDLNDACDDTPNCRGSERLAPAECLDDGLVCHSAMLANSHLSNYPHNLDTLSTQSRSSSNGTPQCKTGRIVFKLFGKEPNDFPVVLREQILDWLSHSPTDIESYIRPGCVILTIYVRQAESTWNEVCRLFCAFEGKYLVQEPVQSFIRATAACKGSQCLSFICSVPNATGRGFIEVEDHGLNCGFFPFIVAEEELCFEIQMLENAIDVTSYDVKNQAIEFLNEMGWLLRRSTLKDRSRELVAIPNGLFSLSRFRWLVAFAMDYQWCAVIKKLLDILFDRIIDLGGLPPFEAVLSEELLHKAVRKNSRTMVQFLLAYRPCKATQLTRESNLFRPDMHGLSKITPLHVAATMVEAESVLDALTNDPAMIGIKAWSSSHDDTGFTPEDYARARGHQSYINLVNNKANKQLHKAPLVLHINGSLLAATEATSSHPGEENSGKAISLPYCQLCSWQLARRSNISRSLAYRPSMLLMVGIAAVCVCVGLLLKGPPEVSFIFPPFTWESLDYGFI